MFERGSRVEAARWRSIPISNRLRRFVKGLYELAAG